MKQLLTICFYCLISTTYLINISPILAQEQELELIEEHQEQSFTAKPSPKKPPKQLQQDKVSLKNIMISPDSTSLIVQSVNKCKLCKRFACTKSSNWAIHRWDIQHNQHSFINDTAQWQYIRHTSLTLNNQYLVYYRKPMLYFWDIKQQKEIQVTTLDESSAYCLSSHPHGPLLLGKASSGQLLQWDMATQKQSAMTQEHDGYLTSLAISPNRQYLASGYTQKTLSLWNANTNQLIKSFNQHHANFINDIVFTPDNKYMFSASDDNTIKLWSVQNPRHIHTFTAHKDDVTNLLVTSDNKYLISSSGDKSIKLWDIAKRRLIHTFQGHEAYINDIALTADNRRLLSCSDDGTIKIWDIPNRKLLANLFSFEHGKEWIVMTPDGQYSGTSKGMSEYLSYAQSVASNKYKETTHVVDLMMRLLF